MAVTSIWRVHGSVGKVLDYVENAEKTTAVSTGDSDLSDVIDYAIQQHKTSQTQVRDGEEVVQRFVSGINCHPSTAGMEMQKVKKFYGKEDGVIAYHGYQSFAPGEATPEIAHEIGVKLARQLWGDRYQVLVATHLDRANHLHSHFVINTVSFVDGIKYHRTKQDYKEMQRVSDALCKEYDGIEARSALMERNLEQLQQEQEIERKEEEQHELFRRGGRSGRPSELERG